MGNNGLLRIAGIGDICLKFDTGMELVLHNVKHVPDMRLNIISTSLLDEDGYHNSSGNGLWKVTLGSLIVARGKRESKLYMTHPKISKSIVNAVDNGDMTELVCESFGSFFLDVIKSLSLEYEHVAMNLTLLERGRFIIGTSLIGFPSQGVRSSNADALDS
nr:retrovirus-related Pol polyprotein from transposon TNT 1-94 [Tanacetum cinerariifolium]